MIAIIEPHADDAFLSLGGHIEYWTMKQRRSVLIVTIFSGTRKRANDARAYANAVGAMWAGANLVEDKTKDQSWEIKDYLRGLDLLFDIDRYIYPLGILHPEHRIIADLCPESALQYMDQPYASMPKNDKEVNDALRGRRIHSFMKPNARKYRHIPLFKDQSKFFYFNPAEKLAGNIELIVQGCP